MNRTAHQRHGNTWGPDAATLRFAVNQPLTTGQLWSIAVKSMFTWKIVTWLAVIPSLFFFFILGDEGLRSPKGIFVIVLFSVSLALAPWTSGWDYSTYRTFGLKTRQIRIVAYMVMVTIILIVQVLTWVIGWAIGLDNRNAWILIGLVSVAHVVCICTEYTRVAPEKSEVSGDSLATVADTNDEDAEEDQEAEASDPLVVFLWGKILTGGIWCAAAMVIGVVAGFLWWMFTSEEEGAVTMGVTYAATSVSVPIACVAGLGTGLRGWITFGGKKKTWVAQMFRATLPWIAIGPVMHLFAGALLYFGTQRGWRLGFTLHRSAGETIAIVAFAGLATAAVIVGMTWAGLVGEMQLSGWVKYLSAYLFIGAVGAFVAVVNLLAVWQLNTSGTWGTWLVIAVLVSMAAGVLAVGGAILWAMIPRLDLSGESVKDNLGM